MNSADDVAQSTLASPVAAQKSVYFAFMQLEIKVFEDRNYKGFV
jgi:hypothetical protein